jgi:hypothetical protein
LEASVPSVADTCLTLAVPQPFAALIAVGARAYWDFDGSDVRLRGLSAGQQVGIRAVPGWGFAGLDEDGVFRLEHPEREDELDDLRSCLGRQLARARVERVEQLDGRHCRVTFRQVARL